MDVLRSALRYVRYTTTAAAACAALVAAVTWGRAVYAWGSVGIFAEALVLTVVTLVLVSLVSGLETVEQRGA